MNPSSSTLLTDLYQLTMAYGYWKTGRAEQEAGRLAMGPVLQLGSSQGDRAVVALPFSSTSLGRLIGSGRLGLGLSLDFGK